MSWCAVGTPAVRRGRYRGSVPAPARAPSSLAFELDLDAYAGPFDLLLALVLRDGIELVDVPVAEICVAYLEELAEDEELDLEAASEFLVLVAALCELKARKLLPGAEEDEEELDPGDRRGRAREPPGGVRPRAGRGGVARGAARRGRARACSAPGPRAAPAPAGAARAGRQRRRGRAAGGHGRLLEPPQPVSLSHLPRRNLPVRRFLQGLRRLLDERGTFTFDEAVGHLDRAEQAVAFWALLELYRRGEARVGQLEPFGPIRVRAPRARSRARGRPRPTPAATGPTWRTGRRRWRERRADVHRRGAAVRRLRPADRRRPRGRRRGPAGARGARHRRARRAARRGTLGVVLERVSGGYALRACAGSAAACARLLDRDVDRALSAAALETLAIVAYAGPVSRPEIARIRGVGADGPVASLLERGLIEEAGRAHTARQRGAVPDDAAVRPDLRAGGRPGLAARARGARRRAGARRSARPARRRRPAARLIAADPRIAVRKRTLRAVRRAAALVLALTAVAAALPAGASAAAKPKLRPVLDLRVSATDATTVTLRWTDRSAGEVRYELAIGTRVVRLAPNARTYRDRPPAGVIRRYTVRACVKLRCAGWSRRGPRRRGGAACARQRADARRLPDVPGRQPVEPARRRPAGPRRAPTATWRRSRRRATASCTPTSAAQPGYGIPFVVVPAAQPRVPVRFVEYGDESDPGPYPIPLTAPRRGRLRPPRARAPAGQLPALRAVRRAPRAAAAGRPAPARSSTCARTRCGPTPGRRPTPPACRSCPASCAATRWRRGEIRHALRFTVPHTQRAFIYPATHYGARDTTRTTRRWACACGCSADFDLAPYRGGARIDPHGAEALRADRGRQGLGLVHHRRQRHGLGRRGPRAAQAGAGQRVRGGGHRADPPPLRRGPKASPAADPPPPPATFPGRGRCPAQRCSWPRMAPPGKSAVCTLT